MGSASGPVICPTFRGRNSDGFHSVHICKFLFVLITTKISYGRLAQLGERSVRNAEVVGSIPISSTKRESGEHNHDLFCWSSVCSGNAAEKTVKNPPQFI